MIRKINKKFANNYHLSKWSSDLLWLGVEELCHFLLWLNISAASCYSNSADDISHDGAWWRHQMETFSALLVVCAGNSPVTGEFPAQRPVTRSFNVFFDMRLNKRLSKRSWDWWFETPWCPLWHNRNGWTILSHEMRLGFLIEYQRQSNPNALV